MLQGPGRSLKAAYSSAAIHGVMGAPVIALQDGSKCSSLTAAEGSRLGVRGDIAGGVLSVGGSDAVDFSCKVIEQARQMRNLHVLQRHAPTPFLTSCPPFQQDVVFVTLSIVHVPEQKEA